MEVEANGFTKLENTFGLLSTKGMSTSNMYAFNASGNIKKYDTAFDIVSEFYNVRLGYYIKRKAYILNKLQYDADLLANKIRFIKEVVNETIQVHKMKKIALEQYLETNKYLKHESTFDYIIRIPVYNLTIDKVEELENEISKAESEIKDLTAKEPQTIWTEELTEFEKVYEKFVSKKSIITKTKKSVNKKKIDKVT
jgi:DNA topoisomerase-2